MSYLSSNSEPTWVTIGFSMIYDHLNYNEEKLHTKTV